MKWIIEYLNGKSISEDELNFKFACKEGIRFLYFIDQNNDKYGVDFVNLTFFINQKTFDFKINGQFEIIQFKSGKVTWGEDMNQKITSWNLGIENNNESYVMSVIPNKEVHLLASRGLDNKTIRLQ